MVNELKACDKRTVGLGNEVEAKLKLLYISTYQSPFETTHVMIAATKRFSTPTIAALATPLRRRHCNKATNLL